MQQGPPFSSDYVASRARFRAAAKTRGFDLEERSIGLTGPRGEDLTIDVARHGPSRASRVLVVSSGTHGVEGFFGAAVQTAFLERERELSSDIAIVMIHAVNPYGFAWIRRVNEDNIDLNRNFVRDGDEFRGGSESYGGFDALLNPITPPATIEPFWGQAALQLGKHGWNKMKNAIASGQYDFPRGLFFGGHRPSRSRELLSEIIPQAAAGAERVVHIDLHTGMGKWATYTLAVPYASTADRVKRLSREFGHSNVSALDPGSLLYEIRGNLGEWCEDVSGGAHYDTLLAEFGTYNPLHVISALRRENRAHHWSTDPSQTAAAKAALLETFCPESRSWQRRVTQTGLNILDRASRAAAGGLS